ncbi:MAG TPA: nucleotide-binding protein [Polyangia bacterium]|nr:nucleotide-binding protein [Polyangia bacterium]
MAKRSIPQAPVFETKVFGLPEIDVGLKKLRRRIEDVRALDPKQVASNDTRVKNAESSIRETIRDIFGTNSPEFREHAHHEIWHGPHRIMIAGEEGVAQRQFAAGIPQSVTMLEGLIARLEEKREDVAAVTVGPEPEEPAVPNTRRVFVVHGHDEEAKLATARFLEKLQLDPVVLSEQPNEGRTIIEKFEHHADVSYAIVLLTPDDVGAPEEAPDVLRPRARQNVMLELGYFIGRLGRSRDCALYKDGVELPSDLHGVLYVQMDAGD